MAELTDFDRDRRDVELLRARRAGDLLRAEREGRLLHARGDDLRLLRGSAR